MTEHMTLIEKLRNPQWRTLSIIEGTTCLDADFTRNTMEEAAREIERFSTPPDAQASESEQSTEWLEAETISHERARKAAYRLISFHFGKGEIARVSIPVHNDDDDLVITRYIEQQAAAEVGEIGAVHKIDYDDFEGTVQGSYVTREGKPGVVLQQLGTRVCHLYGRNRLEGSPPPTRPSPDANIRTVVLEELAGADMQVTDRDVAIAERIVARLSSLSAKGETGP